MNQTLKNECALVTGGSRGIGADIVKRLASEGANVALTFSSSPDRASEVVKAAQAFGVHFLAIQADSAVGVLRTIFKGRRTLFPVVRRSTF